MCGIIGLCFPLHHLKLGEHLFRGLERLEYRGYDSAGIAAVRGTELVVLKGRGKLKELESKFGFTRITGFTGIGHTRWATHGPPTDKNAHPHVDCKRVFAVVHNGIIENYYELKRELIDRGHTFNSETDTEVIPHLVEELYGLYRNVYMAFKEAVKRLKGTFAILMITPLEPAKIFFARKDSPLIIGIASEYNVVASDIPAVLDHTRRIVVVRDHWIGYITPLEVYIEDLISGSRIDHEKYVRTVDWSVEDASKEGYEHFMLKEIHEQPRALMNTLAGVKSDRNVDVVAELIDAARNVYVTGSGTSYHACEFFALLSQKLLRKPTIAFIASESDTYQQIADENDLLIAVSQSGETMDVLNAVRSFKKKSVKVVAISNVVDSAIPRESDIAVYTRAGPEIGVAATKTFTSQVLVLSWLLSKALFVKGDEERALEIRRHLERAPELVKETLELSEGIVKELAKTVAISKSMYFLSRGAGVPVAREGALKIKEVAYVHAEAYPAGESKHGPIALVEPGFPVLFVVPSEPFLEDLIAGNVEEMKARGAFTIGVLHVGSKLKPLFHKVIEVPRVDVSAMPLVSTPPLQMLAYYAAVEKGLDPDKPRNLAKTVTVY